MTGSGADDRWSRPQFTPGGDDALVYFAVLGADPDDLVLDPVAHQFDGLPAGLEVHHVDAAWVRASFEPPLGDVLRRDDPELAEAAAAASSAIVITGTVADPADLRYLRDAIGIATAALDAGGTAVLSLQNLALLSPERWYEDVFQGTQRLGAALVAVLCSPLAEDDPASDVWVHTRGMRVVGRPDLSLSAVPRDRLDVVGPLIGALVDQQVRGLRIPDGGRMQVGPPLGSLVFHLRGHPDDPEFNNVHLDIDVAIDVAVDLDAGIDVDEGR